MSRSTGHCPIAAPREPTGGREAPGAGRAARDGQDRPRSTPRRTTGRRPPRPGAWPVSSDPFKTIISVPRPVLRDIAPRGRRRWGVAAPSTAWTKPASRSSAVDAAPSSAMATRSSTASARSANGFSWSASLQRTSPPRRKGASAAKRARWRNRSAGSSTSKRQDEIDRRQPPRNVVLSIGVERLVAPIERAARRRSSALSARTGRGRSAARWQRAADQGCAAHEPRGRHGRVRLRRRLRARSSFGARRPALRHRRCRARAADPR